MLTDSTARAAKPAAKPYKLHDYNGLFLLVTPTAKLWRLKYRFRGREKSLALGRYPETGLMEARRLRDEARASVTRGADPGEQRRVTRAQGVTFQEVAEEWLRIGPKVEKWSAPHKRTIEARLKLYVYPRIGRFPVADVSALVLLDVLRNIVKHGHAETAKRVRQICGQVFRFAVATGRAPRSPEADIKDQVPAPAATHFAAITAPRDVGALLRSIDAYHGTIVVRCAMQFMALTFVRTGEMRHAKWEEIDFDNALWRIPAERMKMRRAHLVPLSRQAVEVLRDVQGLTGGTRYVFPTPRIASRPLSNNAILAALRSMGYPRGVMTGHGFRTTASTLLNERGLGSPDAIELQLAHVARGAVAKVYNRSTLLPERVEMMQRWADYLDELRQLGEVIPLRRSGSA